MASVFHVCFPVSNVKVFVAGLSAETNSFSPIPTGDDGFAASTFPGNATLYSPNSVSTPLHVWRQHIEADGGEVVESICASAQASGIVARQTYERLRDVLLSDLERALPVDAVLLSLHGAMVAHGYKDCEGDLLSRVRTLVGAHVFVGVELDLHCSLTPTMVEMADIIITFKENPHIDIGDRASELYSLCYRTLRGEIQPVMGTYDTRMVSAWQSLEEPMASFVRKMKALENDDNILSVSFAYGFAFNDTPHQTAKTLVVCDSDAALANRVAEGLGREIWSMRERTARTWTTLDSALEFVSAASETPIVLADFCDNAGGGAPSDATYLLQALIDHGIDNFVTGMYWDPVAVDICKAAGEGASLDLRVGGKCASSSGLPIDLTVVVKRIIKDASIPFGQAREKIGDAVWVQSAGDVDIVLNSIREQTFHPDAFTQLGIDLATKRAIIVKSSVHFRAAFEPIANAILYVESGGLLSLDYRNIAFRNFKGRYWPNCDDPWSD